MEQSQVTSLILITNDINMYAQQLLIL